MRQKRKTITFVSNNSNSTYGHYQRRVCRKQLTGRHVPPNPFTGIRLYRTLQRGKIKSHQHADQKSQTGHDLIYARKDFAYQSFSDQQRMVSSRPSWIWLCTAGKKNDGKIQKLIEYYVLDREQLTCLFVLVDSRLDPQRIDLEFIEWLGENGIPFALIFTKADKQSAGKTKVNVNRYLEKLKEQWEELPPYFVSSSENKIGREEILNYIEQINHSIKEQAE